MLYYWLWITSLIVIWWQHLLIFYCDFNFIVFHVAVADRKQVTVFKLGLEELQYKPQDILVFCQWICAIIVIPLTHLNVRNIVKFNVLKWVCRRIRFSQQWRHVLFNGTLSKPHCCMKTAQINFLLWFQLHCCLCGYYRQKMGNCDWIVMRKFVSVLVKYLMLISENLEHIRWYLLLPDNMLLDVG